MQIGNYLSCLYTFPSITSYAYLFTYHLYLFTIIVLHYYQPFPSVYISFVPAAVQPLSFWQRMARRMDHTIPPKAEKPRSAEDLSSYDLPAIMHGKCIFTVPRHWMG